MDFSIANSVAKTFGRFFGALGTMSPLYYVMPLLLNSGPLSLLVPIAVVMALRSRPSRAEEIAAPAAAAPRETVRLFAIFWIVTVVFLFDRRVQAPRLSACRCGRPRR